MKCVLWMNKISYKVEKFCFHVLVNLLFTFMNINDSPPHFTSCRCHQCQKRRHLLSPHCSKLPLNLQQIPTFLLKMIKRERSKRRRLPLLLLLKEPREVRTTVSFCWITSFNRKEWGGGSGVCNFSIPFNFIYAHHRTYWMLCTCTCNTKGFKDPFSFTL